jgi:hypothetical protein
MRKKAPREFLKDAEREQLKVEGTKNQKPLRIKLKLNLSSLSNTNASAAQHQHSTEHVVPKDKVLIVPTTGHFPEQNRIMPFIEENYSDDPEEPEVTENLELLTAIIQNYDKQTGLRIFNAIKSRAFPDICLGTSVLHNDVQLHTALDEIACRLHALHKTVCTSEYDGGLLRT